MATAFISTLPKQKRMPSPKNLAMHQVPGSITAPLLTRQNSISYTSIAPNANFVAVTASNGGTTNEKNGEPGKVTSSANVAQNDGVNDDHLLGELIF